MQSSGRDADDDRVVPREFVLGVGELDRLRRASRAAVPLIEVENDVLLALELREIHRLHVRIGQREWWSNLAGFEHC